MTREDVAIIQERRMSQQSQGKCKKGKDNVELISELLITN